MSMRLFKYGVTLLPGFCKPYPDELLSSWLTRLAYQHGMGLRELCLHIWPAYNIRTDIDRCISEEQIEQSALATTSSVEEVRATTLHCYENKLYNPEMGTKSFLCWIKPGNRKHHNDPSSYYSTGLMFCPKCLRNDGDKPYFRKHWRLATSTVCCSCGCRLMEGCPHCGYGNSFLNLPVGKYTLNTLAQFMLCCHTCGRDITSAKSVPASWSERRLQKKIDDAIKHGPSDLTDDTGEFFRVLFYLSSLFLYSTFRSDSHRRFIEQVMDRNGLEYKKVMPKKRVFVHRTSIKSRLTVISLAMWLLDRWPGRMADVCVSARISFTDLCAIVPNAPSWFTTPFENTLASVSPPKKERGSYTTATAPIDLISNMRFSNSLNLPKNHNAILYYDIDLNERYYTYDKDDYTIYESLKNDCSSFAVQHPDEETDTVNELTLKENHWLDGYH